MKKIHSPREYLEENQGTTLEAYIQYLKKEKEDTLKLYSENLYAIPDKLEEIANTLRIIDKMMMKAEVNLTLIIVQKLNELDSDNILNENNAKLLVEINSLLDILKGTNMEYVPEDFIKSIIEKVEKLTALHKTVETNNTQVSEKEIQYQYLRNHINCSTLLKRATIKNDGLLISAFGSLAESSKPFYEAEKRRLTQFTTMMDYMNRLDAIKEEYYAVQNSAKNILDKMKKSYKESIRTLKEKYNNTLQEAVDYFKEHPEILCISALDTGLEVPEIETFDDLQKAIDQQRTSQPTKSDFMEVSDTFTEEDLTDSVKAVRIAVKLLFKFEKDEEGFYEFAIAPKYRNAVINAEKYLFNYYKGVYERREAREQSIEATPDLTKEEWEVYDTICKILEHSPISTDEIKEKMTTLKADIAKLIEETKKSISEFASLCEDSTVCPKAFEESVDDFSDIEELYRLSIDDAAAKKKEKVNQ